MGCKVLQKAKFNLIYPGQKTQYRKPSILRTNENFYIENWRNPAQEITRDNLVHSADESLLVIGNKSYEPPRLFVVQQHQHFDVALSIVAEMYAAREAGFHDVVQRFQGRLIVFSELELHRARFRDEGTERRQKLCMESAYKNHYSLTNTTTCNQRFGSGRF